jgi:GNAT superfamily N-acetyltransferase
VLEERSHVLRDGSAIVVAPTGPADEADVAAFIERAGDGGHSLQALARERRSRAGGSGVARGLEGAVIGYVVWVERDAGEGELAGYVAPARRGLGLGTLLTRRAIEHAAANGMRRLQVTIGPGEEATAEMLRDIGLAARWRIDYPLATITLDVMTPRPGWATPAPPPEHALAG